MAENVSQSDPTFLFVIRYISFSNIIKTFLVKGISLAENVPQTLHSNELMDFFSYRRFLLRVARHFYLWSGTSLTQILLKLS